MDWLGFIFTYLTIALINAFVLRHWWRLCQRLNDVNWQALVTLDAIAFFFVCSPLYLFGIAKVRPQLGETFSSRAGWSAANGHDAGELAVVILDAIFTLFTSQRHHCAKAYARWCNPLGVPA